MWTILANQRRALMFCSALYRLILYTSGQPRLGPAQVCSEVSGQACFMLVMEIKSVQCYATHASENSMEQTDHRPSSARNNIQERGQVHLESAN